MNHDMDIRARLAKIAELASGISGGYVELNLGVMEPGELAAVASELGAPVLTSVYLNAGQPAKAIDFVEHSTGRFTVRAQATSRPATHVEVRAVAEAVQPPLPQGRSVTIRGRAA